MKYEYPQHIFEKKLAGSQQQAQLKHFFYNLLYIRRCYLFYRRFGLICSVVVVFAAAAAAAAAAVFPSCEAEI